MHTPHAIRTLRFELLADAVPQARRLPERFSALCRQQLAVVLEEEFAAYCPPYQQLRLSRLVLELPPVADRRLEAELPDLFRRALRTALSRLNERENEEVTTTTSEATSCLALLEHFLRHGHLPWQVAAGSFSLDEVLRSVVEHQAGAFRALLVRLGQMAQRRQRLIWQLNADQLHLLFTVLEPIHAPFLHTYVLTTLAAHRRQALTPVTTTALRSIIYELVLADLLLHASTPFNRRAFVERQVRQLAAQYNLSFTALLRELVAAELTLTPRTQSVLSVLLEDLHQRYRPADALAITAAVVVAARLSSAGHTVDSSSQAAEFSRLAPPSVSFTSAQVADSSTIATTANVETGAITGATTATETVLAGFSANPATALIYFLQYGSLPLAAPALTAPQLLAAFPAWLAQGWRMLQPALEAGGPAALHRLTHLLAQPMLVQLLRLAAPGQVRLVQGVMEAVWQQPVVQTGGNTRADLWTHTLSYLLWEDSRPFRRPEFQQWLARRMSASTIGQTAAALANGFFADNAPSAGLVSATSNPFFASKAPAGSIAVTSRPASLAINTSVTVNSPPLAGSTTAAPNPLFSSSPPIAASPSPAAAPVSAENSLAGSTAHSVGNSLPPNISAAGNTPTAGNSLTLLQAQQVLHYHLVEGKMPPWWLGPAVSPARLRALVSQVLNARPLPDFLRPQLLPVEARQRLAELADFSQLVVLLVAQRQSGGFGQAAGAALAALERRETTGAAGHASGWLLFLRSAYLNFCLNGGQSTTVGLRLSEIQRLAAVYQLPGPATLGKIRRLIGSQPALLADAFFASLNQNLSTPIVVKVASAGPGSQVTTQASRAAPASQQTTANPSEAPQSHSQSTKNTSRLTENLFREAPDSSRPAQNTPPQSEQGIPVTDRLTQLPNGVAARDLVFHLLRYQRLPWWAPANLTVAHQRQLLTQVSHEYRAGLQALIHAHSAQPAFRQMLAELASFAQLARFIAQPGRPAPGRLAPAVLVALDQRLARIGEPFARLLRQAYLTAAFFTNPADIRTLATELRAQATRAGIAWRTLLRYVAWLHRQLPALASAPFFAALLAAAITYEQIIGQPQRLAGQRARSQPRAVHALQSQLATNAFQEIEEYLRTGQVPDLVSGNVRSTAPAGPSTGEEFITGAAINEHDVAESTASDSQSVRSGLTSSVGAQLLPAQWKVLLRPGQHAAWQPLRSLLASRTVRARLLAGLTEATFWPVLRQLYPNHYRLAFRLAADWQLLARQGLVKLSAPALYEVLLALAQATPVASWRPEAAVRALLAAEELLWPQESAKRDHSRVRQLLAAIGRRGLVLRGPLGALLTLHQQAGQVARPAPPSTPIPFIKEEDRPLETVYLANAGLVLLWPFLTMLFDRLGYLENQQFHDDASQRRAALLLQFLASGAAAVPEYQLPLNKLLCGLAQGQPLPRELALTDAEIELGESLLKAVITRWDSLKNTSIAGLRETFLLRSGKLEWLPDDRIVLTVEPKTLDILLDRRPWSISIIKLPWMTAPLYVSWR